MAYKSGLCAIAGVRDSGRNKKRLVFVTSQPRFKLDGSFGAGEFFAEQVNRHALVVPSHRLDLVRLPRAVLLLVGFRCLFQFGKVFGGHVIALTET